MEYRLTGLATRLSSAAYTVSDQKASTGGRLSPVNRSASIALRVFQGPRGSSVGPIGLSTSRCSGTSPSVPHRLSGVSL
jgi:hypothetical protein